jgi:hypothetical protein
MSDDLIRVQVDAGTTADLSSALEALVEAVGEIDLGSRPVARPGRAGQGLVIDAGLRPDQLAAARAVTVEGARIVELSAR